MIQDTSPAGHPVSRAELLKRVLNLQGHANAFVARVFANVSDVRGVANSLQSWKHRALPLRTPQVSTSSIPENSTRERQTYDHCVTPRSQPGAQSLKQIFVHTCLRISEMDNQSDTG